MLRFLGISDKLVDGFLCEQLTGQNWLRHQNWKQQPSISTEVGGKRQVETCSRQHQSLTSGADGQAKPAKVRGNARRKTDRDFSSIHAAELCSLRGVLGIGLFRRKFTIFPT